MQNIDQGTSLTLNFGEKGTIYGCGHSLDTCLYAFGLTTEEDQWEWRDDAERDTVEQTLKDFDFNECVLDQLNNMNENEILNLLVDLQMKDHWSDPAQEIRDSEYLPGDWLKFNKPEAFEAIVSKWQSEYIELAQDNIGAWDTVSESLPESLLKALEKNIDYLREEMAHEWLHGDRSNPGALGKLMKALFNSYDTERIEWTTNTDTIHFSNITEDEIRDFYAYDLEDDVPLPELEEIERYMREKILAKAHLRKEGERVKRQNRAEEYQRQQQRRQTEAEQEKEKARQRKLEKLGKK